MPAQLYPLLTSHKFMGINYLSEDHASIFEGQRALVAQINDYGTHSTRRGCTSSDIREVKWSNKQPRVFIESCRLKMWNPVEIAANLVKFYHEKLPDAGMFV